MQSKQTENTTTSTNYTDQSTNELIDIQKSYSSMDLLGDNSDLSRISRQLYCKHQRKDIVSFEEWEGLITTTDNRPWSMYEIVTQSIREYDCIALASEHDYDVTSHISSNGVPYILYTNQNTPSDVIYPGCPTTSQSNETYPVTVAIYFTRDGDSHYYTPLMNNNYCTFHMQPRGVCTHCEESAYSLPCDITCGNFIIDEIEEFFSSC
jgi:hypothetical protein